MASFEGIVFKDNLVAVKKAMREQMKQNVIKTCEFTVARMKDELNRSSGGGRYYYKNGKWYRASAPYEFPVRVSGHLRKSIKYRIEDDRYSFTGEIYSDDPKAVYLELGIDRFGRKEGSLKPRPFFRLTYNKYKEKMQELLSRGLDTKTSNKIKTMDYTSFEK